MERFVLTELVLRGTRFVPVRDASPIETDWNDLCARLAPQLEDRMKLRVLKSHDIVGIKRTVRGRRNFYLSNTDRTGKVGWLLKQRPTAFDGMEVAYRVDIAQYDQRIQEAS